MFFILGIIAVRIKSDLKIPDQIITIISIYLLAAIGLHGGIEMRKVGLESMIIPLGAAVGMTILFVIFKYQILRRIGKLNIFDSAAIAGTYGSVSVGTFSVGLSFLRTQGIEAEGFMAAILAVLEPTGLIMGLMLANIATVKSSKLKNTKSDSKTQIEDKEKITELITQPTENVKFRDTIKETITGQAILILLSTIVIGFLIGYDGFQKIKIVYEDAFIGVLSIYLLQMGIIAAQRLDVIKKNGVFLLLFAIIIPIFTGSLGVFVATNIGLSVGGSLLFGLLLASASYIAAPAVLRTALPKANPSLYLTTSLGITFPFNIIVNIPILFALSVFLHNDLSSTGILSIMETLR
ncbi:MAG: sodium-dependent bicarbonate transport family permease [Nitrosarchaeum sp.]